MEALRRNGRAGLNGGQGLVPAFKEARLLALHHLRQQRGHKGRQFTQPCHPFQQDGGQTRAFTGTRLTQAGNAAARRVQRRFVQLHRGAAALAPVQHLVDA